MPLRALFTSGSTINPAGTVKGAENFYTVQTFVWNLHPSKWNRQQDKRKSYDSAWGISKQAQWHWCTWRTRRPSIAGSARHWELFWVTVCRRWRRSSCLLQTSEFQTAPVQRFCRQKVKWLRQARLSECCEPRLSANTQTPVDIRSQDSCYAAVQRVW